MIRVKHRTNGENVFRNGNQSGFPRFAAARNTSSCPDRMRAVLPHFPFASKKIPARIAPGGGGYEPDVRGFQRSIGNDKSVAGLIGPTGEGVVIRS